MMANDQYRPGGNDQARRDEQTDAQSQRDPG